MIIPEPTVTPESLLPAIRRMWEASAAKLESLENDYDKSQGTPVFTIGGRYTTRGWTEWTEGFVYGSSVLQYDATDDAAFLKIGRENTVDRMATHVSHVGVHDHGFNNLSTYGNLLRLCRENRIQASDWEIRFYELALKTSAAVQASRWTQLSPSEGYVYSFNGPHSLFIDTIRSCRILMVGHALGHVLMGEGDQPISLAGRALTHIRTTDKYNVYHGTDRDHYDVPGRTAHEAVFNLNDGSFRCPSSQQGFSGLTTWTRGLSWAMLGYAEQLEFLRDVLASSNVDSSELQNAESMMLESARQTCDFYLANSPTCGIPYWDTGAPQLHRLGDYLNQPADPFNQWEPVDSSAAAIAAQGLLRLGDVLQRRGDDDAAKYRQAGLHVTANLLQEPYLSTSNDHQGLLLHSIYHQPRGWDEVAEGQSIANGQSCMWGDYHLRELALYVQRLADDTLTDYTFYGCLPS
ncbi:glycosyl hydrolase [Crateriforma conspicua]|uniref:Unsaturated glucuronyl hydrolase n=1 Tax=Crateriforma conspicua TaxID=2527996 RepID=A0A5C5Y772_9PLAN|nr:glycosyl hydrolase [Crateriforma conspicua]TWT70145.1 Unsaturated glucuronyl hydrolase [Crateriforma conspicua]